MTTTSLEKIYKDVETAFSGYYRKINEEDKNAFTGKLVPSIGKLGFDVDFYGRGHFPPGAYHSEGHQDSMGLCLYLALMNHLLGNNFTFAVLDDVLMSVDAGHRRQVCTLLKENFSEIQFVFTTHDEIWLRHMKSAGLIKGRNFAHFRTWTVDLGPTEWDDRDVWDEIDAHLAKGDVRAAAALLRHYLEYFAKEACDRLRANVEFRGDAQFVLGDLLPSATSSLGDLLKKSKVAATSWNQEDVIEKIETLEAAFAEAKGQTGHDNWQVNAATHFNVWADLRVRPGTLCRITEFSEHESNGRELDEGERVAVEVLPVLGQSAAAVEPGDGAFDHPTPGLDDEALHPIGSLDDLGLEIGQDAGQGAVKDRPLIGAVGEQFPEKGKQTEQGRQQRETAVAILNVGGGDDAVQQQALRIDQNMPLLALDQLAGIEAVAVDASPPFSALFTL